MGGSAYAGLFVAAFLAATVIPAQSEGLLVALLAQGSYDPWALIGVASVGNVLGSIVNWWLGRGIERFKDRRWFPVSEQALSRAQARYARYGRWSLLLSWVPIIGDPITVVAGVMRERLWIFTLLVGAAKTLRYVFLAYAYLLIG
jgi:membrane protein YqaA with SNARE-associated domain